jgi:hypothetical protein
MKKGKGPKIANRKKGKMPMSGGHQKKQKAGIWAKMAAVK